MKIQYLGDSRDSFKWDYQDHLTSYLAYSELKVVPMLTPDDLTNQGKYSTEQFSGTPRGNRVLQIVASHQVAE